MTISNGDVAAAVLALPCCAGMNTLASVAGVGRVITALPFSKLGEETVRLQGAASLTGLIALDVTHSVWAVAQDG